MHANDDMPASAAPDCSTTSGQWPGKMPALEDFLDKTLQAVMIIQGDRIVYCNGVAREMIGLDCAAMEQAKLHDCVFPDDRGLLRERFDECLAGHSQLSTDFNCRFLSKSGETHWAKIQTHSTRWQDEPALLVFAEAFGLDPEKDREENSGKSAVYCDQFYCDDLIVRLGKDGIVLDFTLPCRDPLFKNLTIQRGDHIAGTDLPNDVIMLLGRMVDKTLAKCETQAATFAFKEGNNYSHYEARFHAVTPSEVSCIIRNVTAQKRNEDSLNAINKTMLSFGSDPVENIQQMTELAGRMLGADMCVLHTLSGRDLDMTGEWNLPPDIDFPHSYLPFPCEHIDVDCRKHDLMVQHCVEEQGVCPPDFERLLAEY
ncbi:MAG: PAS domain-containing protein [Candidatus Sumerlaeota bacterium]